MQITSSSMPRAIAALAAAFCAATALAAGAQAQGDPAAGWPRQPVKIVVGLAAGAVNDVHEPKETWPQFTAVPAAPGTPERRPWQTYVAGRFGGTNKGPTSPS